MATKATDPALQEAAAIKAKARQDFMRKCQNLYFDEELTITEIMERTGKSVHQVRAALGLST